MNCIIGGKNGPPSVTDFINSSFFKLGIRSSVKREVFFFGLPTRKTQ